MLFNEDKCKFMFFNNKRYPELEPNLRLNGKPMERSYVEKDLGIFLTSDLKWNYQATQAANRANMVLIQLKRAFKYWTINTFKQLYVAFVRPHLEYAVTAWCPYVKKDAKILEKVQRRATKLVHELKNLSYEQRLKKLSLTTLETRRKRGDLIEFYKKKLQKY